MNNRAEDHLYLSCVEYFQERQGYRAAFALMRKKWKTYGRSWGSIVIKEPSKAERELLGGFLGKDFFDGPVRFSMQEFEAALEETRFRGISLKELLEGYFGEELTTNKQEKEGENEKKSRFFHQLREAAAESFGRKSTAYLWLEKVALQKRFGYKLILGEYEKSPKEAKQLVDYVCRALEWLSKGEKIRLAVLGTEISRNPHQFDRNTAPGKMLIQALCCVEGVTDCNSAEDILMLYYNAGIKPDDISSFTAAYGVHVYLDEREHPAFERFIKLGEPYVITLFHLGKIKKAEAKSGKVYVVENQMVFSHLCEELKGREIALVCTSGQIKTASLMLLDMLGQSGCRIYYSGDFDPEGLGIAQRILTRYPASARLWCMGRADYAHAVSNEAFSEVRVHELENISHPSLKEVKEAVLREKRAGYQERLIGKMIGVMLEDEK